MGNVTTLDVIVVLLAASAAGFAVFFLAARFAPKPVINLPELSVASFARVFLFQGQTLVEATPAAEELLRGGNRELEMWPRLMSLLARHFPNVDSMMAGLPDNGYLSETCPDGHWKLEAEWVEGVTRIVLEPVEQVERGSRLAPSAVAPLVDELETLREVVNDLPVLTWREDAAGEVIWANSAYIEIVSKSLGPDKPIEWPLPKLFETSFGSSATPGNTRRVSTRIEGEEDIHWYECVAHSSGAQTLVFGLPANRLVKAEASLREFIQTLTQTFAHLPAGVAIFDRNRRLALFNPALTDLSALEVDFLSSRPTLYAFLDRLREKRRMPEPKDYKGWRQRISDLEEAAATGTHQETWSLPTGQTFAVTGRPHPGGAVAFLFEDISAEIGLTRRFRSEIEMSQTVLDTLDDAIAVFSPGGTLVQSNRRYHEIWGQEPTEAFGELSILEASRNWQDQTLPTPTWGEARSFVTEPYEREEWTADATLLNGSKLGVRVVRIQGGSTMIMFNEKSQTEPLSQPEPHALTA